ncbi:Copper-exporting P-type ATPase B [subsurface metagenome]|nr:copper-translocating P-type ATPase [Clostridia bacterium]
MPKDPVCGMEVNPQDAIKLEKDGKTFYFCSQNCKNKFLGKDEMKMDHKMHAAHKHAEKGHAAHHAHMVEDFKRRFWISLILTIPVLILSPLIQSLLRFSLKFPGDKFILFGISTFIYFYGGWPFLKGIFNELKKKQPGMMTLIALAITVAYVYSSGVVFGIRGKFFFWELVTLIDIMLLGHWIEMRSVMGASHALEELARLMPSEAHLVLGDGSIKDIKLEELKQGDRVLIKPGEKIPADGRVIDGESEINEAMITGESKPVSKGANDEVIGGSVNGSGSLTIEVKKTGKDSYLSQVVELVRAASESKSKAQDFANRAAFWLTLIAVTAGVVTLIGWLTLGKEFVFALERMVTVMVITCPHALGLAIPLVIAVITALSAQNGLLIRNRTAFENARNLQMIVFDKTGTLTKGEFGVSDIISLGNWSENDLLRKVASIEANSEHTIAKGIVKKAKEKNLKLSKVEKFEAIAGKGAKAQVEGEEIFVGNKGIFDIANVKSVEAEKKMEEIALQGKTIVFVISGKKIQGIVGLSDIIRDESKEAVGKLKDLGLELAMITGDNNATAKYVAGELGLDTYFAEVLPDKKSEKIKQLQRQGKKVAMVGDGVNDAPALAQADVGIAIGAGTDVAVETADVILVKNDPRNVVDVIALSRATQRKMVQNLVWATGYNIFAIPLAAGVLYKYGIILAPAVGALIMSLSTIIVAINARLISYKRT